MAMGFPLHIDLEGNNCTVFGGGKAATRRAEILLRFGAKVTIISPLICPTLEEMSKAGVVRHIPRKYFRGDCSNSQLCIAATDDDDINIRIATECKAKSIPVNVISPKGYGTFRFPRVIFENDILVTIDGTASTEKIRLVRDQLQQVIPQIVEGAQKQTE